jgi:hypothetical protein
MREAALGPLERERTIETAAHREAREMLCSIVANGDLHVFQVTPSGDLVHRSHVAGTENFPTDTITNGCDPNVTPITEIFNNNLHVFAQKTSGEIVWGMIPHGGKADVKVLGS